MFRTGVTRVAVGLLLIAGLAGAAIVSKANAAEERPMLGITMQDLGRDMRDALDYHGAGVLVTRVLDGTAADRAGLRKGDLIVSLNSRDVNSSEELSDRISNMRVGQSVTLRVKRDGDWRTITATLGARDDEGEDRSFSWRSDGDEDEEAPTPPAPPRAPRSPRAPSAPSAPRAHVFRVPDGEGREEIFNFDDLGNRMILPGIGRGRLGVRIQDMNRDLSEYFEGTNGRGALVMDVVEGSAAERAGLKVGDVIVKIDDESVDDSESLLRALRDEEGPTSVTVVRKGVTKTLEADLPEREVRDRRVLRYKNGPDGFEWHGDGLEGLKGLKGLGPQIRKQLREGNDDSELRRELQELREELRELRRELDARK